MRISEAVAVLIDLPQICSDYHIQLYEDDTAIYSFKPDISQIQFTLQVDFDAFQQTSEYEVL